MSMMHRFMVTLPLMIKEGIVNMQQNVEALFNWATKNRLKFNVGKAKAVIFGSAQNIAMLPVNLYQITISGFPIT